MLHNRIITPNIQEYLSLKVNSVTRIKEAGVSEKMTLIVCRVIMLSSHQNFAMVNGPVVILVIGCLVVTQSVCFKANHGQ